MYFYKHLPQFQQIRLFYKYVKISDISKQNIGENINIKGWIKGHRNMKSNLFLDINDGSCVKPLQIVMNKDIKESNLGYGASINVSGLLAETPKGQLELKVDTYNILGKCILTDGYPFVPKQIHPPEYIRDHLHLRSRYHLISSILRVRHNAIRAFNNYLHNNGYFQIHTPILTTNDCEGAGEVFTIKPENDNLLKQMKKNDVREFNDGFFNEKVFLSVSGQLHLEATCYGLGNVYSFGPTFRAENSKSPVHLTEFYMLEVERSFMNSLKDLCLVTETMIKKVTEKILNDSMDDIEKIRNYDNHTNQKSFEIDKAFHWLQKPFTILTYSEAIEILQKHNKLNAANIENMVGLSKDQELFLIKFTDQCPVFVIDWPKKMKQFYMKQKSTDLNIVESFDFLVPNIGELIGGSIREDNYERLQTKIPNGLDWYLELRKFGGITTGGFGLGFERYLQFLLNVKSIKDVIPFPRWPHNCSM